MPLDYFLRDPKKILVFCDQTIITFFVIEKKSLDLKIGGEISLIKVLNLNLNFKQVILHEL